MNISSDDIIFRRAVIQLLDVENGNFEAARELLFLKNDIMELLRKQLVYIMQADEVKQAADIVTDINDNEGERQILDKYFK